MFYKNTKVSSKEDQVTVFTSKIQRYRAFHACDYDLPGVFNGTSRLNWLILVDDFVFEARI